MKKSSKSKPKDKVRKDKTDRKKKEILGIRTNTQKRETKKDTHAHETKNTNQHKRKIEALTQIHRERRTHKETTESRNMEGKENIVPNVQQGVSFYVRLTSE